MDNSETLLDLFEDGVKQYNNPKLLNYKYPTGTWSYISAQDAADRVRHIALGLDSIGIKPGDRIALLAESRPLWTLFDLGMLSLGAINVPIYTTQSLSQVDFILRDSTPKYVAISTHVLYQRILPALYELGLTEKIIMFEKEMPSGAISLAQLEVTGKNIEKESPARYQELKSKVKPSTIASIIYTSDESGVSKGVMLTHGNLVSNVKTCASLFHLTPVKDTALTYLPLSHVFERTTIYHYLYRQISIYYADSIERMADNLLEVKPVIMTTVPRFLEKAEERMIARAQKLSFLPRKIFQLGFSIAKRFDPEVPFSIFVRVIYKLLDLILYGKWRERFGGRFRFMICGGARLKPELARVFTAAGIPLLQGYGLTETSPVISVNRLEKNRIGSVGQVIPGVTVRIAEDGEICVSGPNVMQGYFNNEEATKKVLDGTWFKTGDIGHLDDEGYLYITDRKKDLIKTSGGKFIAPHAIEKLLTSSPLVERAVVIGDGRKFAVALLFPNFVRLKEFAEHNKIQGANEQELVNNRVIFNLFERVVEEANKHLANWEMIKKFAVIAERLLLDVSPNESLKAKRKQLETRYRDIIESFYGHAAERNLSVASDS